LLSLAIIAAVLGGCDGRAEEIVRARAIPLYEDQPEHVRLGDLRFEAGYVLSSAAADFGGLSGLWIRPDGSELVTVSDRGIIWRASLEHDGDRLVGLSGWRSHRLTPLAVDHGHVDAESLADQDGALVVALEQNQPLRRVVADDAGWGMRSIIAHDALREAGWAARNAGIEALTDLADGGLLAIAEGVKAPSGHLAAWRITDGRIEGLSYAEADGFAPTGADRLDQVIYVLERRFDLLKGGFVARIMALDTAQVEAGAPLQGRELGRLSWPALSENFEGIAVHPGSDGRILLYLISDDNFLPIQRTLLLQFSLAP